MIINKVVATDPQTKEKQTFTFGTATQGKDLVTTKGGKLNSYLEFCFKQDAECVKDVEVEFVVNQEKYLLNRIHSQGGLRSVLKKWTKGSWQIVAHANAVQYVEDIINAQLCDMLKIDYVSNVSVDNFHGDLLMFDEIRLLADVKENIVKSINEAKSLKENALRRVKEYSADVVDASPEQLDALNSELDTVARDITVVTAQLGELKAKQNVSAIRQDIEQELNNSQQKYSNLMTRRDEIEELRARVKLRDDVELLIPKVKTLRDVEKQRSAHKNRLQELASELEWLENELVVVNQKLDEKQLQYTVSQEKRAKIEAINSELAYISSLYDKNKRLNATLIELNEREQRLLGEKALYTSRLESVEKAIGEVRESLDSFDIPANSIAELLESVRVDVKIDEVTGQIEKLQSEIALKESQIAEKESNLVVQVKRFRAVADLDMAVTPIKAKDTILQVLDTKFSKLESVNAALNEKLHNFERALEDYRYRLLQLEQSKTILENQRDKVLLRKQEEFKREVYLTSQQTFMDDASGVIAVSANLADDELDELNSEIAMRNKDRDALLERVYNLEGAIRELRRHMEINNAEMETLQREKDNIVNRYNEIITQNTNETVSNYLQALSRDNGTKYLLDVQQDAVRSEAELSELKHSTESQRAKLSALKSRLNYLKETQRQMDEGRESIESIITSNDTLKNELADISERLTVGYEQYKAISRQLEHVESKLEEIRGATVEVAKTVRVHERQIAEATSKAKRHAGSDDIEQAVANFKYELGDVESELQMIAESKQNTEKEVFKKRLELEKTQWLYESRCHDYDEMYQELQFEFALKGLNIDQVSSMDLDANLDTLRKIIAEFDTTCANLAEKIDNLYTILKSQPSFDVSAEEIAQKENEIARLESRQRELEAQRNRQLNAYVSANDARRKATVAAAEARTLSNLRDTLNHNQIISLLISDKIKSTLSLATQYLNAFTGKNYLLVEQNYKIVAQMDGKQYAYDDLSANIKVAVYVSVILSVPNTDASEGKWIFFDEHLAMDTKALSAMLRNIGNVSYVTAYSTEKVNA